MRRFALFALCTFAAAYVPAAEKPNPETDDAYRWLEDVNGARAMSRVRAENAKTVAVVEKDTRCAGIYKTALLMAHPDLTARGIAFPCYNSIA